MVQRITELVKDVAKYADELQKKHKAVKDDETSTLSAVQAMQASTLALQKAKDLFSNRMQEVEKLRKDNSSVKDLEKAEAKMRKQQDDYKALMDKHNPVKTEFERRMTITCKVSCAIFYHPKLTFWPITSMLPTAIPRDRGKSSETDERILVDLHRIIAE